MFIIYFLRDCLIRGGKLNAYKIKPVLFLYAVGFLAASKTLHKRKEKYMYIKNPVKMINDSQRNSEIPSNLVLYVLRIVKM